ncbi:ribosome silencing factor [Mycetocola manganoxydans]|uniref:Ribosomal silencing factor RsfS n=1 Tax=Mycetocola manganoxydans TaxID=699879 RepID=A0A3L6ZV68_9MICO|nr:ribosome silencing factor [Mycetocola manganoxydans]
MSSTRRRPPAATGCFLFWPSPRASSPSLCCRSSSSVSRPALSSRDNSPKGTPAVTARESTIAHLEIAAAAANDKGAEDLVALDVSGPLPFVDIFLIATGRSERNVVAVASEIEDKLNESGVKTLRREGRSEGRWILLDFGDLVVHVFHEEERLYYSLERLWKDCPVVPISVATPAQAE